MRELSKYELDFFQAWEYGKDQLEGGNSLSLALLKLINFKKGKFYTLLPKEANLTKMYDFSCSGILPSGRMEVITVLGKQYNAEIINSLSEEVSSLICKNIQENNKLICIFEDVIREFDDPNLEDFQEKKIVHIFEKEVYYLLNSKNCTPYSTLKCISNANAFWHLLFVISSFNELINKDLDKKTIKDIARNAVIIGLGAYDGEGYIFWEKEVHAY